MAIRLAHSLVVVPLGLALMAGCNVVSGEEYGKVQRELINTQAQIAKLQGQIAAKQQAIDVLNQQVAGMRGLSPEGLEQLIVPERIALEAQSGGYGEASTPSDDGIVLYVQPIDRNGDVVKAAGSIKITLLDLANPPQDYVLGEYAFDVDKTRELWYGRMWTHHITVRCPWKSDKPPLHGDITARVEFYDLLTGRTLTAQGVYKIRLPVRPASE